MADWRRAILLLVVLLPLGCGGPAPPVTHPEAAPSNRFPVNKGPVKPK
jgi:hypothetical protein